MPEASGDSIAGKDKRRIPGPLMLILFAFLAVTLVVFLVFVVFNPWSG